MVSIARASIGHKTLWDCSGHLVPRLHFVLVSGRQSLIQGRFINKPNFQHFLDFRNSPHFFLAGSYKFTILQSKNRLMIENVPEDEPETILMREALFERDRLTEKDDRGKPREENFDGGIDKPSFL